MTCSDVIYSDCGGLSGIFSLPGECLSQTVRLKLSTTQTETLRSNTASSREWVVIGPAFSAKLQSPSEEC